MTESAWDKHKREQLKRLIDREKQRRARKQALIEERAALRKEIRITPVTSPFQRFIEYLRGEVRELEKEESRRVRM